MLTSGNLYHTVGEHKALESLQKRAMRIIFNHYDYLTSLIIASIDNLQARREHLAEQFFLRNVLKEKSSLYYLLPIIIMQHLYSAIMSYADTEALDLNSVNRLCPAKTFELSRTRTERFRRSFIPYSLTNYQLLLRHQLFKCFYLFTACTFYFFRIISSLLCTVQLLLQYQINHSIIITNLIPECFTWRLKPASGACDILGDILSSQQVWHRNASNIIINKDGNCHCYYLLIVY